MIMIFLFYFGYILYPSTKRIDTVYEYCGEHEEGDHEVCQRIYHPQIFRSAEIILQSECGEKINEWQTNDECDREMFHAPQDTYFQNLEDCSPIDTPYEYFPSSELYFKHCLGENANESNEDIYSTQYCHLHEEPILVLIDHRKAFIWRI